MSDPYEAVDYVIQSGVQFLAPSFGNVHGSYPPEGPKWDLNR
jgi:fructose-bisphosphate aldolase class II